MPNLLLTMWDTIKSSNIGILVAAGLGMFAIIGGLSMLSYHYTLSGIKSRTVGDGQHGTARWATDKEIRQTYAHVPFKVKDWREGVSLPTEQGLVLGCKGKKDELTALVDSDDIHCLMIAASGAGKTAFFLYPNLEYACASGMSFLALDTKGDLARNYGSIAKKYYGYEHISVIDLRNPTRSDGNNLLTLINRYMDIDNGVYKELFELVKEKDYFVLTTNVDYQFQKAGFDKHRLFYTQGDYGLFQCSKPCCQETYDNEACIRDMLKAQKNMRIPTKLIPHCPKCGKPMTMNLRADDTFAQDKGWYHAAERYEEFLRRHKNLHILFLELGVGYNTPAIIKYPFWQMTAKNQKAVYACVNSGEAVCPKEIALQSICIHSDIKKVIDRLN